MGALSFACAAKEIKTFARTIAFDFRGHGDSKNPEGEKDLSEKTLTEDALKMLNLMQIKFPESTFVIVGHSLGGAIACKLATTLELEENAEIKAKVVGLIVIDVSEGTAIEALPMMETIVAKRPKSFNSIPEAIKWT